jgi:serine protease Do
VKTLLGWIGAVLGLFLCVARAASAQPTAETPPRTAAEQRRTTPVAAEPAPGQTAAVDPKAQEERAQRGVVVLERAGRPIALGAVLHGDGRILTALSPLTHGNDVKARFVDGTTLDVRVEHSDRGADLALLVAEKSHLADAGLRASRKDASSGASLLSFTAAWTGPAKPARVPIKGTRTARGGDGRQLFGALVFARPVRAIDSGAPLLDDSGDVLGVIVQACSETQGSACQPVSVGVATPTIKAFLRSTQPNAAPPLPWVGIRVARPQGDVAGVQIRAIHPDGPAGRAGLRAARDGGADVIAAVDGVPVTTPRDFYGAVRRRAVGDSMVLLVLTEGRYRDVNVRVDRAPPRRRARLRQPSTRPDPSPSQHQRNTPAPAK